jgi:hypothetical protein
VGLGQLAVNLFHTNFSIDSVSKHYLEFVENLDIFKFNTNLIQNLLHYVVTFLKLVLN